MSTPTSTQHPTSLLTRLIGIILAVGITVFGVIVGIVQGQPVQQVILFAVITLAGSAWIWQFFVNQFDKTHEKMEQTEGPGELYRAWLKYRLGVAVFLALALAFLILSLVIEGFFNVLNVISVIILLIIIVLTMTVGKFVAENKKCVYWDYGSYRSFHCWGYEHRRFFV